jgi:hypothetical protein
MTVLIQTLSFPSSSGNFNADHDTQEVNEAMVKLQNGGAKILDVKVSIILHSAIYLITYETTPRPTAHAIPNAACSKCGTQLAPGTRYCTQCGATQ